MSRELRIAKQAVKRHHLHIEPAEVEELYSGLLFTSTSRAVLTGRGIIGETETILQLREIKLKPELKSKSKAYDATLIAVPALSNLRFVISPKQPEAVLSVAFGHLFASWISHAQDPHQIYFPPDSEDYLMYLIRASGHLPNGWCLEGTGSHLQLFKLPAEDDSNKLEDALRLAGELRPLLVPA